MSETIFLLKDDGQLLEMNESGYISEDFLQALLADYPKLLAGSQINADKPRRWLFISREVGVPDELEAGSRWSLDHLFIDQDGILTIVEVKRSTDTRIRREVVGQILDYAANAVSYWSLEYIQNQYERTCNSLQQNSDELLSDFLQGEIDPQQFWETVQTNLKAGKLRLLIVADTIPKELQRIIEFLNEQMSPAEILGIEVKQFVGQNLKTLVPRVIGQTAEADIVKSKVKPQSESWNEEKFFAEFAARNGYEQTVIARRILDWAKPRVTRIWYGSGKRGSLVPILKTDVDNQLFAIWTNGSIEIYFQHYKGNFKNTEKKLELLERLNQINGLSISEDKINARPWFQIQHLLPETELHKFIELYDWFLREVK